MKTRLATLSAFAALLGTAAIAGPFEDAIVENLQGLGYGYIEVNTGPDQVRAEAVRGAEKLEVVYDRTTGGIIRQERGTAEADYVGRTGVEFKVGDAGFVDDHGREDDDDRYHDDDRDNGDDHGDRDDDRGEDRDDDHGDDRDDDHGDDHGGDDD